MPIPTIYRKASEAAIASYSYTDIAEGTGVTQFWLYSSQNSVGLDYHINSNSCFSASTETVCTGVTIDFDLPPFNLPKNIKGTAIINLCYRIDGASGSGSMSVTLKKYSGTTETSISSAVSSPDANAAPATYTHWTFHIPITTIAHFKKGDILRVAITGTGNGSGVPNIQHDPKGTAGQKDSNIFIPFVLDL